MSTSTIDIPRFDISSLPATGFIEILGKRGTGKTTWCRYALNNSPSRSKGMFIVVCGSETVCDTWKEYIHPLYVMPISIEYIERIIRQRNGLIKRYKKKLEPIPEEEHVTLIFDDITSNKKVMRSSALAYLASNSRHLYMSIYLLPQYHVQIPSEIRTQFDFIIVLATKDERTLKRLYSEYCAGVVEFRMFRSVIESATHDRGACIINNQSTDISTMLSYCWIDPYPFNCTMLGHTDLWKFANTYSIDDTFHNLQHLPHSDSGMGDKSENDDSEDEYMRENMRKMVNKHRSIHNDRKGRIVVRKL